MNYNIEDLKLLKERQEYEKRYGNDRPYTYNIEKTLSEQEKIDFIDKYWNETGRYGMATYMLNLINKFNAEKDSMPKDQYGEVKTVSLKAWLKKNDPYNMVNKSYSYGHYHFVGTEFTNLSKTPMPLWGRSNPYYGQKDKIVDYWFHSVLCKLDTEEWKWAKDHNPLNQKARQIEKYCDLYGSFGIKLVGLIGGNGESVLDNEWLKIFNHKKPTEEEIDKILEVYKEVDAMMQAKTKEIQERLGWELYKVEE